MEFPQKEAAEQQKSARHFLIPPQVPSVDSSRFSLSSGVVGLVAVGVGVAIVVEFVSKVLEENSVELEGSVESVVNSVMVERFPIWEGVSAALVGNVERVVYSVMVISPSDGGMTDDSPDGRVVGMEIVGELVKRGKLLVLPGLRCVPLVEVCEVMGVEEAGGDTEGADEAG